MVAKASPDKTIPYAHGDTSLVSYQHGEFFANTQGYTNLYDCKPLEVCTLKSSVDSLSCGTNSLPAEIPSFAKSTAAPANTNLFTWLTSAKQDVEAGYVVHLCMKCTTNTNTFETRFKITQSPPVCTNQLTPTSTKLQEFDYEHGATAPKTFQIDTFFTKGSIGGCVDKETCVIKKSSSMNTCENGSLPTEISLVSGTHPVSLSAIKTVAPGYAYFICMTCTIGTYTFSSTITISQKQVDCSPQLTPTSVTSQTYAYSFRL